ncbi:MAG TPA: hypothetical protein VGX23_25010 [Actinocrinis sp.]|nr:hypothetical protein [Actinocrinis sp.]
MRSTDDCIQGVDVGRARRFRGPGGSPPHAEGAFMRYNPPPNWPQPPADWTPPPGWEPDPYWPPPPSGWELWVADDETIISPFRAASAQTQYMSAQSMQPWYRRTGYVVLLTIFAFPVGLALLWKRTDWSVKRRSIITAAVGFMALVVLAGVTAPPAKTAASNPVAAGGVTPAAVTPTASPSALPTTVAPTTAAPTIVVTTPPPVIVTTTPAPVHTQPAPVRTQPAPVHTTKAPAPPKPVKTNPPAQQGCTPLTNGGKCYTPGELCRSSDHNATGIDANGDAIKCEDNDGWRWERI